VDVNIPADLPPAHVDAVQIGQVVLNLVTNAAQAMEEAGGVLTVRASARDGVVRLDVTDTGPGIAPEHLAHVFEPLFTTKARGIGLGLSVSRSLAAANGGTITVASEPGRGATFTLELPTRGNA
jgi:signal transduction histidine kinase